MGDSNRRKKQDPTYSKGSKVKTRITVSELTGKFLVMASVNDQPEFCVSPHYKKEDAEAAAKQVELVFSGFSPHHWKNDRCKSRALSLLNYEDDDEAVGVYWLNENKLDFDLNTLASMRSRINEHGLIS